MARRKLHRVFPAEVKPGFSEAENSSTSASSHPECEVLSISGYNNTPAHDSTRSQNEQREESRLSLWHGFSLLALLMKLGGIWPFVTSKRGRAKTFERLNVAYTVFVCSLLAFNGVCVSVVAFSRFHSQLSFTMFVSLLSEVFWWLQGFLFGVWMIVAKRRFTGFINHWSESFRSGAEIRTTVRHMRKVTYLLLVFISVTFVAGLYVTSNFNMESYGTVEAPFYAFGYDINEWVSPYHELAVLFIYICGTWAYIFIDWPQLLLVLWAYVVIREFDQVNRDIRTTVASDNSKNLSKNIRLLRQRHQEICWRIANVSDIFGPIIAFKYLFDCFTFLTVIYLAIFDDRLEPSLSYYIDIGETTAYFVVFSHLATKVNIKVSKLTVDIINHVWYVHVIHLSYVHRWRSFHKHSCNNYFL